MSPYQKKLKDKRRKNLFRKWHRRVGFTAALFLINLAITGILLNHSDDLELHKQYIQSGWIVDLYGIKPPETSKCIDVIPIKKKICQLGEKLYLDQKQLVDRTSNLIGLVEYDGLFYLATSQKLYIYTQDFELVEMLDENSGLPIPIKTVTVLDHFIDEENKPELIIMNQKQAWKLDPIYMNWNPTTLMSIMPPRLRSLQGKELIELQNIYLSQQLTYLKFIQDLHSGRIFSLPGKLVTDLSGIIIIVLVCSGFYAWQRRKKTV